MFTLKISCIFLFQLHISSLFGPLTVKALWSLWFLHSVGLAAIVPSSLRSTFHAEYSAFFITVHNLMIYIRWYSIASPTYRQSYPPTCRRLSTSTSWTLEGTPDPFVKVCFVMQHSSSIILSLCEGSCIRHLHLALSRSLPLSVLLTCRWMCNLAMVWCRPCVYDVLVLVLVRLATLALLLWRLHTHNHWRSPLATSPSHQSQWRRRSRQSGTNPSTLKRWQ